ncbi:MAG: MarR family winged helix-turn-helix transcriptional regulator [Syntrophaceae bacterium]
MELIPHEKFNDLLFWLLRELHQFEWHDVARFNLSWYDMHVMKYLLGSPVSRVSDIAGELRLPLFKVSRLLNDLSDKGFVSREKVVGDKRNTWIRLTAKGHSTIRKVQDYHYELIMNNLKELTPEEALEVLRALEKVSKVMNFEIPNRRPARQRRTKVT